MGKTAIGAKRRNVFTESPENQPAPKMKTRKEIEQRLVKYADIDDIHTQVYSKALKWVLGIEEAINE